MLKIIIGQRGWVWVGNVTRNGDTFTVQNARCIRRWGTSGVGGLAHLASTGPTSATVLEDPCELELHLLAVVGMLTCDPKVWV